MTSENKREGLQGNRKRKSRGSGRDSTKHEVKQNQLVKTCQCLQGLLDLATGPPEIMRSKKRGKPRPQDSWHLANIKTRILKDQNISPYIISLKKKKKRRH